MPKILSALDGKKTYIGCALGAMVLIAHRLGVPMPGVEVNDAAIMNNLFLLYMTVAGRSALGKYMPAILDLIRMVEQQGEKK